MAKKAKAQAPAGGDTLGDIAAGLGSLLGNAEKQWRAWQGPRDAVVQAVTDVRDRAVALLSEMDVAGLGSKKSKKDKKKAKKADKKKDAARPQEAGQGRARRPTRLARRRTRPTRRPARRPRPPRADAASEA